MSTIVKIDRATGEVLPGEPQNGDYVRITTAGGAVVEQEYTVPTPPSPQRLDHAKQRAAMIRGRALELDKRGKYQEASALRATIGE